MNGNLTPNPNKIKLEMCLYTNESPPKKLELNTSGKPLFKGKTVQDLVSSKCEFNRVHFREVSSHFRGGWLFIVICPVLQQNSSKCSNQPSAQDLEASKIKPFIMDKVVIKAKKLKKKHSSSTSDCTE